MFIKRTYNDGCSSIDKHIGPYSSFGQNQGADGGMPIGKYCKYIRFKIRHLAIL